MSMKRISTSTSSSNIKTKTAQSKRPQDITLLMLLASPLMTMMISSNWPTTSVEFSDSDQEPTSH